MLRRPVGNASTRNWPLSLVLALRVNCVPSCRTITAAPGTTAPAWSVMAPTTVPLSACPNRFAAGNTSNAAAKAKCFVLFMLLTPLVSQRCSRRPMPGAALIYEPRTSVLTPASWEYTPRHQRRPAQAHSFSGDMARLTTFLPEEISWHDGGLAEARGAQTRARHTQLKRMRRAAWIGAGAVAIAALGWRTGSEFPD